MTRKSDAKDGDAMAALFAAYLDEVQQGRVGGAASPRDVQLERNAYQAMMTQIEQEENEELRAFMQSTVEYYCRDCSMLLSYILDDCWNDWIRKEKRRMKTVRPIELYIALESIMAGCCDTTGYTGPNNTTKYPLRIPGSWDGEKTVRYIDKNVPRVGMLRSYFKFGVHKFLVGQAIHLIIGHLEKRYGLDFVKLEKARRRNAR